MPTNPFPDNLAKWLLVRAERTPQATAYFSRSSNKTWVPASWTEYQDQVGALAAGLIERGMSAGDRVAILLPTCHQWEVVHQAALILGATIVGLDPRASDGEIDWALDHAEAKWLVLRSERIVSITPPRWRSLTGVIVVDGLPSHSGAKRIPWAELIAVPSTRSDLESLTAQRTQDDLATILFTSGTTGTPKAIPFTHRHLLAAGRAIVRAYPELGQSDTTICWLPLSALFQRIVNLCAIAWGMTSYFLDDPHQIMETVSEVSPSFLIGVPRFYEKLQPMLAASEEAPIEDWRRRIKFMVTGSAPLGRAILEDLHQHGVLVLEAYGVSENAVPMAANRVADYRFGSVGKPLPENEVRFGNDGEILVRSPGLFAGYFRETHPLDRFTADGFYRTGDCGYLDEDGFLYLTGRKAEFIKTSTGRRISPVAMESIYGQSPYFDQVVVCGEGRTYLVALISLNTPLVDTFLASVREQSTVERSQSAAPIKELVLREMRRLEEPLAPYERIQAAAILPRPLSVERGELTSVGKLRRGVISANYHSLLDQLYGAPTPCILDSRELNASCTTETSP